MRWWVIFLFTSLSAQAECFKHAKHYQKFFRVEMGDYLEPCDANNRSRRVLEAIDYMARLDFSGKKLGYPYNQEIIGYDWQNRMGRLAPNILWGPHMRDPRLTRGDKHCTIAQAFAGPGPAYGPNIYLCPNLFGSRVEKTSVLHVVATMLHETRHLQGKGFQHTRCAKGGSVGKNLCDPSIRYKGAYAVEMEAFAKIGTTAVNVHPALAAHARIMAYVFAQDRFKTQQIIPPEERTVKAQLLLSSKSGQKFMYDGTRLKRIPDPIDGGRIITVGNSTMAYIPHIGTASLIHTFYLLQGAFSQEEGDGGRHAEEQLISQYNQNPDASRTLLRDAIFARFGDREITASIWGESVKLQGFYMFRDAKINIDVAMPAGAGKPVSLIAGNTFSLDAILVLTDKDQVVKIEFERRAEQPTLSIIANPIPGFMKAEKLEETLYVLDKSGRLFFINGSAATPVTAVDHDRFETISQAFRYHKDWPDELDPD